jgi:hypothetical protein
MKVHPSRPSQPSSTKGQAKLIGYVITILLTVIILTSVTMLMYVFYNNILKTEIEQSLRQLAIQTSDSIVRIYERVKDVSAQPTNYTALLLHESDLNLPTAVSNKNYEIILVTANPIWSSIRNITVGNTSITPILKTPGAKVIAQTTEDPVVSVEIDIPNINIVVEGRSENGNGGKLKYYRHNINGTIYDIITLGEPGIIVSITNLG